MSARNESLLATQARIRAEEAEAGADEMAERADFDRIARKNVRLSEAARRRIWNGYKGGTADALRLPADSPDRRSRESRWIARTRIGREWLTSIGQEPDWTLEIDRRGQVLRPKDAE